MQNAPNWVGLYELILPHVVRIETESGAGTGFLFGYNKAKSLAAVATAAHVIDQAYAWRQPIKLFHDTSGSEVFLADTDRAIFMDSERDSASILIGAKDLPLPDDPLPLLDPKKVKRIGVELAWVGYPSVAYPKLCFFTGCVSAHSDKQDRYYIDGVAINGVSGGPVFANTNDKPELVGSVSAYLPNRVQGSTLPGLLRAQDISGFHDTLAHIHSLDDAREREKELEQAEKKEAEIPSLNAPQEGKKG
jgi:hypothetical protein